LIYMLLMCKLTSTRDSNWVFDTGSVVVICNSKQELRRLAKDGVTMGIGSVCKVDVITIGMLALPSGSRT
jgi:hypothetical protein